VAARSDADILGPIGYLIVEYPGNKMTGNAFLELMSLVDRGLVRVLDLQFVMRAEDGSSCRTSTLTASSISACSPACRRDCWTSPI